MKELSSCGVEEEIIGDMSGIFVNFVGGLLFLVVSMFKILLFEKIGGEGNILEDGDSCWRNVEDVFCEMIYLWKLADLIGGIY